MTDLEKLMAEEDNLIARLKKGMQAERTLKELDGHHLNIDKTSYYVVRFQYNPDMFFKRIHDGGYEYEKF